MLKERPLPGSKEASVEGCICPEALNRYGEGAEVTLIGGSTEMGYWVDEECPVHGDNNEGDE